MILFLLLHGLSHQIEIHLWSPVYPCIILLTRFYRIVIGSTLLLYFSFCGDRGICRRWEYLKLSLNSCRGCRGRNQGFSRLRIGLRGFGICFTSFGPRDFLWSGFLVSHLHRWTLCMEQIRKWAYFGYDSGTGHQGEGSQLGNLYFYG